MSNSEVHTTYKRHAFTGHPSSLHVNTQGKNNIFPLYDLRGYSRSFKEKNINLQKSITQIQMLYKKQEHSNLGCKEVTTSNTDTNFMQTATISMSTNIECGRSR